MVQRRIRVSYSIVAQRAGETIHEFRNGGTCRIGRNDDNDWVLEWGTYPCISGQHARLDLADNGDIVLSDPATPGGKRSSYGTLVNGVRVNGSVTISPTDDVRFVAAESEAHPWTTTKGAFRLIFCPRPLTDEDVAQGVEEYFEMVLICPPDSNDEQAFRVLTRKPGSGPLPDLGSDPTQTRVTGGDSGGTDTIVGEARKDQPKDDVNEGS